MLGVAVTSLSRFLRRINSNARSLSEDSRESRACTSGGLSATVAEGNEERYFGFDCELELGEREASCLSIDVSGSCAVLRDSSRFLDIIVSIV